MINEEKKLAMELAIKYYAEIGDAISIDEVIAIAKKIEGYLGGGCVGGRFKTDDSGTEVLDNICVSDFLRKCEDKATSIELSQPVAMILSVMSDLLEGTKFEKTRSGNIELSDECHAKEKSPAKSRQFKIGDMVRTKSLMDMAMFDVWSNTEHLPFTVKKKIAEKNFTIYEVIPDNDKRGDYFIYEKEKGCTYFVPEGYLLLPEINR